MKTAVFLLLFANAAFAQCYVVPPLPLITTRSPTSTVITTYESRDSTSRDQDILDQALLKAAAFEAAHLLPHVRDGDNSPLPPFVRDARRLVDPQSRLDNGELLLAILARHEGVEAPY